jgi:hypothetical protein
MMKALILCQLLAALCLCGCAGFDPARADPSPSRVAAVFLDAVKAGDLASARAMMHPGAAGWEESFSVLCEEMRRLSYMIAGERIEGAQAEVDILFRNRAGAGHHDDLELKLHRGRWFIYGL